MKYQDIMVHRSPEYLAFRELLNVRQLGNLQSEIKNWLHEAKLKENTLEILELGSTALFHVYIDKAGGHIWLLGGHWLREGEPRAEYLNKMRGYAEEILAGRGRQGFI